MFAHFLNLRTVELAGAGIVVGSRIGELLLAALVLKGPFVRRSVRRRSPRWIVGVGRWTIRRAS